MTGRIRSIKPEVLEDEIVASLSDAAWRLWVSAWVLADDHGNLRAAPKLLAASVWQDTTHDVEEPLFELVQTGRFEPYSVRGQRYVHVRNFRKHQRVDNAGKPRVPGKDEDDGLWLQELRELFANSREQSPQDSEEFRSRVRARIPAAGSRPRPPVPRRSAAERTVAIQFRLSHCCSTGR